MKLLSRILAAWAALLLLAGFCLAGDTGDSGRWVGAWVSAQQLVEPHNMPPKPGLNGKALRQIIRPTLGGSRMRLTFSNADGREPLTIAAANVAKSTGGSTVDPAGICPLAFGGRPAVTILPGTSVISDPVSFNVRPFENLAVTTSFSAVPAAITGHPGSRTTSFIKDAALVSAAEFPEPVVADHWYFLAAVDVWSEPAAQAIVVLGDSITDGRGSTTNLNNRWPDDLARRLDANPRTRGIGVLNQGIGGNRLLRNGLGPSALQRFDRDVLVPPGARWLIIFEGINDVGTAKSARTKGEPAANAPEIIMAYEQLIVRGHAHGLRVFGATLMPFEGFDMYYDAQSEADRQAVNRWIRTSGKFDGVIDFDAIARDGQFPGRLSAAFDGGDHLHPSAEGYRLMAEAIDLSLFEK